MIAIDTNILVHAHRADSEWHEPAARCVESLATGRPAWAIPWPCIHEFFAIVTHKRIYNPPTPREAAVDQIDAWLESPSVVLLAEKPEYWPKLRQLVDLGRVDGPRVHDARVAALCLSQGVAELWSADRDFNRFADLHVKNPLLLT